MKNHTPTIKVWVKWINFLETHNLQRQDHKEIKNLNISIVSKEVELVFENLQTQKIPGQDGFTGESHKTFKEITNSSQTLPKNWRGRNTFKIILWGWHYTTNKAKQGHYKKRKL